MTKPIQYICLKNPIKIYKAVRYMYATNGMELKIPEPNHHFVKNNYELDLYYSKLSHSIKFPEFSYLKKKF